MIAVREHKFSPTTGPWVFSFSRASNFDSLTDSIPHR